MGTIGWELMIPLAFYAAAGYYFEPLFLTCNILEHIV
jgi:hypothetical protein